MVDVTTKVMRDLRRRPEIKTPIATDMFLPNHSGISSHPEIINWGDDRWVNVTGDTMTGSLVMDTNRDIQFRKSSSNIASLSEDVLTITSSDSINLNSSQNSFIVDGDDTSFTFSYFGSPVIKFSNALLGTTENLTYNSVTGFKFSDDLIIETAKDFILSNSVSSGGFVKNAAGGILSGDHTVDIGDTDLAVTSPITLAGNTIGFDFTTTNSWSGLNTFTNTTDSIAIAQRMVHDGDVNTYLEFTNDAAALICGGFNFINAIDSTSSIQQLILGAGYAALEHSTSAGTDTFRFNPDNANVDFYWSGDTTNDLLHFDASNEDLTISMPTTFKDDLTLTDDTNTIVYDESAHTWTHNIKSAGTSHFILTGTDASKPASPPKFFDIDLTRSWSGTGEIGALMSAKLDDNRTVSTGVDQPIIFDLQYDPDGLTFSGGASHFPTMMRQGVSSSAQVIDQSLNPTITMLDMGNITSAPIWDVQFNVATTQIANINYINMNQRIDAENIGAGDGKITATAINFQPAFSLMAPSFGIGADESTVYGLKYTPSQNAFDAGTVLTSYGLYYNPTWSGSGTINNYIIWAENGDLVLDSDSSKIIFGEGQDAEVYYDGTDLVLNPDAVGSGKVYVNSAYKLPNVDGTNAQVMTTNGSGVLSWATQSATVGITPTQPSRAFDTTYQNTSGKSLIVYGSVQLNWLSESDNAYITCKTDSSSPPTTVVQNVGRIQEGGSQPSQERDEYHSFWFIVEDDNYYRIDDNTDTISTMTIDKWNEVELG